MELICDYREKSCINNLKTFVKNQEKFNNILVKTENLAIGDFTFGNVIVERKSHQDLAASIIDGRYKEQCNRLTNYIIENPSIKVFYFIEGNLDLYFQKGNIDKEKIISSIISLTYEKGFSVIMTKNVIDTCDFLLKFTLKYYTKYNTKNDCISDELNNAENLIKQQKKKSSQISRENIGILMLSMVPNISTHLAQNILTQFDNDIFNLLNLIKTDPDELYHLKIPIQKNSKYRTISKTIVQTLINYFSD